MKIYTDNQISEVLKKVNALGKEFGKERYNNSTGEWLSHTIADIESLLRLGDDIDPERKHARLGGR